MGDYLITEAGFGADMGAERFFDVKCRVSGLRPDVAVLVVDRARAQGALAAASRSSPGKPLPPEMLEENPDDVRAGAANLRHHIEILAPLRGLARSSRSTRSRATTTPSTTSIREIAEAAGARVAVTPARGARRRGRR